MISLKKRDSHILQDHAPIKGMEKNKVWLGTKNSLDWRSTWILKVLDWYAATTSVSVARKERQNRSGSLSGFAHDHVARESQKKKKVAKASSNVSSPFEKLWWLTSWKIVVSFCQFVVSCLLLCCGFSL